MARPVKYTEARAFRILEGLKAGMTRTAAATLGGVDYDTFLRWLKRYAGFAGQVTTAEQEAEARYTQAFAKAAFGQDVIVTRTTRRPVKIKAVNAEGVSIEQIEYVTEETTETRKEFDWRAAESWLSRRRRKEWGNSVHVSVDEEISQLLAQLQEHYAGNA